MFIRSVLFAAAAVVTMGSAASASTIIESFNDFPNANNVDTWQSQGFDYTPIGTTNGQCFDAICLREDQVNTDPLITNITRVDEGSFDFLGFYLNFNGLTADSETNFFNITADDEAEPRVGLTTTQSFEEQFLDVYEVSISGSTVDITKLDGDATFDFSANGYFIIFTNDQFDDVTKISLSSDGQGTARFDCAAYSVPTGGSIDIDTLGGCEVGDDPEVEIPLPGGLPLLAGALGLTALIRRRAKA